MTCRHYSAEVCWLPSTFFVVIVRYCCCCVLLFPNHVGSYNSPRQPPSSTTNNNYKCWASKGDLAGVWKLTCAQSFLPKFDMGDDDSSALSSAAVAKDEEQQHQEIWLMLNQDGSFVPYGSSSVTSNTEENESAIDDDDSDDDTRIRKSASTTKTFLGGLVGQLCGKWDFQQQQHQQQNGNNNNSDAHEKYHTTQILILAADRPKYTNELQVHDTILRGELKVQIKPSLLDNPRILNMKGEVGGDDDDNYNKKDNNEGNTTLSSPQNSNINTDEKNDNLNDIYLSIPNGTIEIGKFNYPKRHANFFDPPMIWKPTTMGTFRLEQILGKLTIKVSNRQEDQQEIAKYHKQDFYGRKFVVTTMPVPPLVQEFGSPTSEQPYKQPQEEQEDYPSFDIRVMPIEFYQNNTFQAWGSSKILRGRFGITGNERDKLWFQVSLFGAGRSSPGSVYSEGNGLTQEDRRGYVGKIEEILGDATDEDDIDDGGDNDDGDLILQQKGVINKDNDDQKVMKKGGEPTFTINGEVSYGSDFAKARPDAIGLFSMKEIVNDVEVEEEVYDDDDDDATFEGEFQ